MTDRLLAGGKGANLGELLKIKGILVPDGFCVTTAAYKVIIAQNIEVASFLDELIRLKAKDSGRVYALCAEIRSAIEAISMPAEMGKEIAGYIKMFGENDAFAVRSSATAEDLPSASFAGQEDTYLNVIGTEKILDNIRKCWASLFTERATAYRIQKGFDHRKVNMAVVVQKMISPHAAGILFTADPLTSSRKVSSIDASYGLGEVMVSGLVNTDNYKVRDDKIIEKKIAAKTMGFYPLKYGGTEERAIGSRQQNKQTLTTKQVRELSKIGRMIEAHFACPQDIEWCLADNRYYIVQSRPITTLFPVPVANDNENHIYVSVGHQQMMTDAMKPLGLSFFLLTTNAPMRQAAGRLFVDVTRQLSAPATRKTFLTMLGQSDPLIKDALNAVLNRRDFIKPLPDMTEVPRHWNLNKGMTREFLAKFEDGVAIVAELIAANEASIEELKRTIQKKSGEHLFDFIKEDIGELKKNLFNPLSSDVIRVGMYASAWINKKMMTWLGEKNAADKLSQSVPNNITSEMGLALLDLSDTVRSFPEVVDYLSDVKYESFLDELPMLSGGSEVQIAINVFLNKYGMRCAGEIDITRMRWSEKPAALVPIILNNIKNFPPGTATQRFREGEMQALAQEQDLLGGLAQLPNGKRKVSEARLMIDLLRNLIGYREYPKYGMVSRYFVYKQALLKESELLVRAGIIRDVDDIYYLSFGEFQEVVRTSKIDYEIIEKRKQEYKIYDKLSPPRVITSDGEILNGTYKREDLPENAMAGLAVSSGIIEGRARVILNMENADLGQGDILVTKFTDPSWTPLFVSIKGLVTEVGGLMTHGAVIAREYGLPTVVGVSDATKRIKDGQRIRVNGTDGFVEVL